MDYLDNFIYGNFGLFVWEIWVNFVCFLWLFGNIEDLLFLGFMWFGDFRLFVALLRRNYLLALTD